MKPASERPAARQPSTPAARDGGCVLLLAASLLISGCNTPAETPAAVESTKYTLESTERFVALDRGAQQSVSCTGLLDHPLADGRMEVVANLRNRESRRVTIEASCVFRDAQGIALIEETPWQVVTLPENATVAARFVAAKPASRDSRYTVRIRENR